MFYIVNSLESVSWRTLRGDLVPADQIKQATAIIELLIACAQVLGFMIGGIVVALTGVAGTYYFSAITYFLAIVGFFFVHPLHHHVKTTVQRTSYRLRDGISYILQYRWMQKILLLQSFAIILIGACLTLLPIIVQNTFHVSSIALGVMKAMVGTGYLAMSVWLVLASHRIQKPARILTIMCVVGGICGLAFAFTHDFVLCLPLLFILGVCVAPSMTVTDLLL